MLRRVKKFLATNCKILDYILLYLSLVASTVIIIGAGATQDISIYLEKFMFLIFSVLGATLSLRALVGFTDNHLSRFQFAEVTLCLYFVVISVLQYSIANPLAIRGWVYAGIIGIFLVELSKGTLFFDRFYFNPTLLFVISFLLLILLGTLLLMLPNATTDVPLSLVDALFMSTSAVCITGLSVIDVSSRLSDFGQIVLLALVQLGGLGVMTFTGFFGYFFSGGFSYKNQLMFTELVAENKLASVINTLLKIVFITLLIETLGAMLIYFSVDASIFSGHGSRTFFAVFHAVSAFCNAGFSILPEGLHDQSIRFNYGLQMIVAILFIFGGLGFGIVLNGYYFVKRWITNIYKRLVFNKAFVYRAWVINFNSRLIAWTTLILLVIGTIGILSLEFEKSLAEHSSIMGKLAGAFFMGASPRTAGFNSIDMNLLSFPSIILIMLLMWIGASPG
jgi:Trk-type K+ transport system membrane component